MSRRRGTPIVVIAMVLILSACQGGAAPSSSQGLDDGSAAPSESSEATGFDACGSEDAGDALRIGVVTGVGQLEDKSFNEAGYCGGLKGAEMVGGSVDVIVTQETADIEPNIQQFVDQDYDVIVTIGFSMTDATNKVAKENPDINFVGVDQFICVDAEGNSDATGACEGDPAELIPNRQGLLFREAEAGYLAGIVAAGISETGVIGTIGGITTVPPVVDFIGGYENGAKSYNPDVEVKVLYVSDDVQVAFSDPAGAKAIAEQMIGEDADVLFGVAGLSGQGVIEAACDAGVHAIGVDVDQHESLPALAECLVTSAEKKLVDSVASAIGRVAEGTAEGGNIYHGADSDPAGIGLSPYHEFEELITPEIQAAVDEALAAMASGDLDPCEAEAKCFGE